MSLASLCIQVYRGMGMWPFFTSSQIASSSSPASSGPAGQSEKFMLPRPSLTWLITSHEIGATFEYHGHTVSCEWQLRQDRSKIALTSAGTARRLVIALAGSLAGLVRAGRTTWMATKTARPMRIRRFKRRPTVAPARYLLAAAPARRFVALARDGVRTRAAPQ